MTRCPSIVALNTQFMLRSAIATYLIASPTKSLQVAPRCFVHTRSACSRTAIMSQPTYLTGDKAGIHAFLDRFDVCDQCP